MNIHAAIQGGGSHGHIGEAAPLRHQLAEAGGGEAEMAFGHGLKAVLVAHIPQVVGQHRVHHHPGQGQAMAQQDQPVVFGVLQGLGMGAAGQPGGQGGEHLLQGQLAGRWRWLAQQVGGSLGAMADRDVGQISGPWAPAQTDAHQFGAEGIEIGGFGVEGHRGRRIGAGQQPAQQRGQVGRRGHDLGLKEGRTGAGLV